MSVALNELDANAVNPFDERQPHRYTARERERPGLGCHLDVLCLERRDGVVDVDWTESDVVDRVARRLGLTFGDDDFERLAKAKFDGLAMDGNMMLGSGQSEKVLLLKPMTYMNLSGPPVLGLATFYKVPPPRIARA